MKPLVLISIISFFIISFSSCHNSDQHWDSKSSADTLNNMKDSVADPNKAITKDLVMKVNKADAKFVVFTANAGMAEVILSKLAKSHSMNENIKSFANMMINDHQKINEKLVSLSKSKGISLPDTTSNSDQKISSDLSSKNGKSFDKEFIKIMIKDHTEDIKAFQSEITLIKDPDLKNLAIETLPILKMHFTQINEISKQFK